MINQKSKINRVIKKRLISFHTHSRQYLSNETKKEAKTIAFVTKQVRKSHTQGGKYAKSDKQAGCNKHNKGVAKCQKLIGNQDGINAIRVGQNVKMCKHACAFIRYLRVSGYKLLRRSCTICRIIPIFINKTINAFSHSATIFISKPFL